jgi:polyphosphate glucokinase
MAAARLAIGVDVGGSGIKTAIVDVDAGKLVSERLRVPTPSPSTPEAVTASISRLVQRLAKSSGIDRTAPLGLGMPGVVLDGVLKTAANIDPGWVEFPVSEKLAKSLGRPVTTVNDADAAGIAEMRFGAGVDKPGVVVVLTLGTGVGSGVFVDGTLVPNTEFGQMEIRGRPHLGRIEDLMWPKLFILGGGVSKNADRFVPRLTLRAPVVPAQLRNDAGIIGAAVLASAREAERQAEREARSS